MGYEALATEFKHNQDDIAQIVGKSRSHVANTLRLLKLPEKIKSYIRDGKLSAGHARMLVGQPNAEQLAEDIVARGLNVRQVEALTREEGKKPAKARKARGALGKDPDTLALERRLSDALGFTVTIDHREGAGTVHVRYRDYDQLDEIIRRLEHK
jgi:ParB family chromosome partitioning protein